jgi:hypothetical protein
MIIYSTTAKTQEEQRRRIIRANDMRKAGYSQGLIERRIGATYKTLRKYAEQLNIKLTS